MKYRDLRDFLGQIEARGQLRRVADSVSPRLEMTAVGDRLLRSGGPAVLFTQPAGFSTAVLINLFGTPERVALGMGVESAAALREVGQLLAALKEPEPPRSLREAGRLLELARALWDMKPALVRRPVCQAEILQGAEIDLAQLPIQTCW
ncbi:MAG: UbiD family decarboxylase, partial [Rubrivivax sp.]|nr:UbiD family decarboxylase [Rubrivivax sp.]